MGALLVSASNINLKDLYHVGVLKNIQMPHDEESVPLRKIYSIWHIKPQKIVMWCDALTDKVYKYLSTISKVEMKDKYTRKQLAIIKGNKVQIHISQEQRITISKFTSKNQAEQINTLIHPWQSRQAQSWKYLCQCPCSNQNHPKWDIEIWSIIRRPNGQGEIRLRIFLSSMHFWGPRNGKPCKDPPPFCTLFNPCLIREQINVSTEVCY